MSPSRTALIAFLGPLLSHLFARQFLPPQSLSLYLLWQLIFSLIYRLLLKQINGNNSFRNSVSIRSLTLGFISSLGIQLVTLHYLHPKSSYLLPLGLAIITIAIFHFTEFLAIALKNPRGVKIDDFIFCYDISNDYPKGAISYLLKWFTSITYPGADHHLAMFLMLLEFTAEAIYFPQWKFAFPWISYLGFSLCLAAEGIRKVSMLTAGSNFNHIVQEKHQRGHILVTKGIYSWWRHPSYVGQFYWIIGTQIILLNPLLAPFVALVTWLILKRRIPREEVALVSFFGKDYVEYRKKVGSGIPGIP